MFRYRREDIKGVGFRGRLVRWPGFSLNGASSSVGGASAVIGGPADKLIRCDQNIFYFFVGCSVGGGAVSGIGWSKTKVGQ